MFYNYDDFVKRLKKIEITPERVAEELSLWLNDEVLLRIYESDPSFYKYYLPEFVDKYTITRKINFRAIRAYINKNYDEIAKALKCLIDGKVPREDAEWLTKTLKSVGLSAYNRKDEGYVAVIEESFPATYGDSGFDKYIFIKYIDTDIPFVEPYSEIAPLVIAKLQGNRLTRDDYIHTVKDKEKALSVWKRFIEKYNPLFSEYDDDYFVLRE